MMTVSDPTSEPMLSTRSITILFNEENSIIVTRGYRELTDQAPLLRKYAFVDPGFHSCWCDNSEPYVVDCVGGGAGALELEAYM
jgi:hypothetical protein